MATLSNGTNNTLVTGTNDADSIYNSGASVSIDAGSGNDTINNNNRGTALSLAGSYAYINAGDGDDSVLNYDYADYSVVEGGAGADTIFNRAAGSTIFGGTGNDSIRNLTSNVLMSGDDGNDYVYNGGGNDSTVLGGEGNDTFNNNTRSDNVLIDGGEGDDYFIYNWGINCTLLGGEGNDTVTNYKNGYSDGKLTYSVGGANSKMDGGTGDDFIENSAEHVSMSGGAGADTIRTWGEHGTINGGTGNDIISLESDSSSNLIQYASGDGNDTIIGFKAADTLSIGGGTPYTRETVGSDVIVAFGYDSLTLSGAASFDSVNITGGKFANGKSIKNTAVSVSVGGTDNDDLIDNRGVSTTATNASVGGYVTIKAGAGDDSIRNDGRYVLIEGEAGNDTITNTSWGMGATFSGGDGNDFLSTYNSDSVSLDGGNGNDTLDVRGTAKGVTVTGGEGNDSIKLSGDNNLVQYAAGNDTVTGFTATDTLSISGGTRYTRETVGSNVIVGFGGVAITLSGAASLDSINITGGVFSGGKSINNTASNTLISGTANDDIIDNRGVSTTATNASVGGYVTIKAGAGDDSIRNDGRYVLIEGEAGNDTLTNTNWGMGATFSGGDGNDFLSTYNSDSVSLDGGNGNDTLDVRGSAKDITVTGGAGDDSIKNTSANVSIDGGTGSDTVYNQSSAASVKVSGGEGNDSLHNDSSNVTLDGGKGNDTIQSDRYNTENISMNGGDGNDYIWNYASKVTMLGDAGNDTLYNYKSQNGGENVLMDGGNGHDNLENAGNGVTMRGGAGDDTLTNNKNDSLGDNVLMNGGTGDDYLNNFANRVTMTGGTGSDSIKNNHRSGGDSVSIDGGAGDDIIENFGVNVTISGGDGNDSIVNYAKGYIDGKLAYEDGGRNVTITGGTGDDSIDNAGSYVMFEYAVGDGNDLITGFNDTSTLKIGNGTSDTFTSVKSGDDIIVTVGEGKITLVGAGAASLHSVNIWGKEVTPTLQVITNGDATPLTLAAAVITADASKRTKAIKITGNAKANSIVGGSKADTLGGGKGNDTLTGGKGNDLFVYTAGKDVITDYAEGDKISIASGSVSSVTTNGNDVIFTVGTGKITVKGAADKVVTYNDADGSHTYFNQGVVIEGKTARLTESFTADSFSIADSLAVENIDASVIKYDIELVGNKSANSIAGGISNDTLNGGAGNDILTGGAGADTFVYSTGDGNDLITDYTEEDFIQINGTVSKVTETTKGTVILWVGSSKISVKGGSEQLITYVDAAGVQTYPKVIELNDARTAAALLSAYTADTFDLNTNPLVADYATTLKTIDASAVTHDINIIANNLNNRIIGGDGNDTLYGGKGNDTLKGGAGSDVFVYTAGNDYIIDYAEEDNLRIDGTISKITPSGKNVILTVGSNKISLKSAAGKVITFTDDTAVFNASGTSVTLTNKYIRDSFDVADYGEYAGTLKTINASAVTHDLIITGNKNANKIFGGSGNDTLIGGKGNDNLNGVKGSDVFVYNDGDSNDTIVGYTQGEDRIQIASGKVDSISVSGSNVVFTVGNGKIFVKGGTEQLITYVDAKGNEHFYPDEVKFSDDGKQATILSTYQKSAFKITDYGSYGTTVQTINGADVTHNVSITANSKANTIFGSANNDYLDGGAAKDVLYGGEGNDTLIGGTGNDTLWGGDGSDVFLYNAGDGNDVIADYAKGEKISVTGAAVDKATVSGSNVVLTVGASKITVRDAKDKTVTYYVDGKKKTYKPASSDLLIDDNYSADAAQLSNIVEPFKASYTPYDFNETMRNAQCVMRNELVPSSLFLNPNCFFSKA